MFIKIHADSGLRLEWDARNYGVHFPCGYLPDRIVLEPAVSYAFFEPLKFGLELLHRNRRLRTS